jgi:hypothetical protein
LSKEYGKLELNQKLIPKNCGKSELNPETFPKDCGKSELYPEIFDICVNVDLCKHKITV